MAFPTVRSLAPAEDSKIKATIIASTGNESWGETDMERLVTGGEITLDEDKGEKQGPQPVAMASSKSTASEKDKRSDESRLVVVGDSEFFSNKNQHVLGNRDFFLNVVNWLGDQSDRFTIRPRTRAASGILLTEDQAIRMRFLTIDALPVLLLGLGIAVRLVRRGK